jgi:hypothetical protein
MLSLYEPIEQASILFKFRTRVFFNNLQKKLILRTQVFNKVLNSHNRFLAENHRETESCSEITDRMCSTNQPTFYGCQERQKKEKTHWFSI